jgi:hypothetical protein
MKNYSKIILFSFSLIVFCLALFNNTVFAHPVHLNWEAISKTELIGTYLGLGFLHIIPFGFDHILFVIGICLINKNLKSVITQITAFTVAHSITLGLAMSGFVSAPSYIVEPIIAVSILFIAVENIFSKKLSGLNLLKWRVAAIFIFGLVHGLGFASVLMEAGLPKSDFFTALLSFNAGVELGQLSVILIFFLCAGLWLKSKEWYQNRIVVPASAMIGIVSLYWTIERIFF